MENSIPPKNRAIRFYVNRMDLVELTVSSNVVIHHKNGDISFLNCSLM